MLGYEALASCACSGDAALNTTANLSRLIYFPNRADPRQVTGEERIREHLDELYGAPFAKFVDERFERGDRGARTRAGSPAGRVAPGRGHGGPSPGRRAPRSPLRSRACPATRC